MKPILRIRGPSAGGAAARRGLRLLLAVLLIGLAALLLQPDRLSRAAVYWASVNGAPLALGVRGRDVTVCFVGNAVTARPDRVRQIVDYIQRFEWAANIRFYTVGGARLSTAAQNDMASLRCPPPTQQGNGWDAYAGDIRVVISNTDVDATDPVPGNGCETYRMTSAPDATSWSSDRLDVFWRGWDNTLRHKWWTDTDGWQSTESLGGNLSSGPGAASWAWNRLIVLARWSDGSLRYRRWDGNDWILWQSLGGSAVGDPDVVSWGTNRLDIFVRWNDNTLRHRWSTDGGATWNGSGWENLGGTLTSGPGATSWDVNRLIVFVRGLDGGLWYRRWDGSAWSGWQSLGGALSADPDAASRGTNRVDVFVRWSDNTLRRRWSTDGGLTWSEWQNLGDVMASGPTAVARHSNYLGLYWRGANDSLWSRWWEDNNWVNAKDIGDNAGWGSWSSEPWSLNEPNHRACLYNLKLGDDPWNGTPYLNHTLHEFGHALGLSHEHSRPDANAGCTEKGYGDGSNAGLLTPYDRDSVMHYKFASCGIDGNYGNSGLSAYDRLALHIMYPEDVRVVEFYGNTVIRAGQPLQLTSAWHAQGATAFTTKNWVWKVDGVTRSTTSSLAVSGLAVGEHTLSVEHDDFLDRHYTYAGKVLVLTAADYNKLADVHAANAAALAPIIYQTDLPLVVK